MPREKFIPNVGSRSTRRSHCSDNTSIPSENIHHQSRTVSVENNSCQLNQLNQTEKDSHYDEGRLNQSTQNNTSNKTNTSLPTIHDTTRSRKRSTNSAKTAGQDVATRSKMSSSNSNTNTLGQSLDTHESPGLTRRFRHLSQSILSDKIQIATRNDSSNQGNASYASSGRKRAIPSVVTAHKERTDNQLSEHNDNDTDLNKNDHQLIANDSNTNGSCLNSNYNENTLERGNLTTGRSTRNRPNKADSNLSKKKRGQVHHTANDVIANKRRRLKKKTLSQPLDSSQMTMSDLIYYNPSTNPMKHKSDDSIVDPPVYSNDNDVDISENNDTVDSEPQGKTDRLPDRENRAPQVSIGPDGKIILNEDSLVIEAASEPYELTDIIDESDSLTTYRSYKKKSVTDRWSAGETSKFYRALSQVGTDFSLMRRLLFPKRDRNELKNKFKREDRFNRELVNQALRKRLPLDTSILRSSTENQVCSENNNNNERPEITVN